ncbi:MAG TPA: cobalt-precorrin-7 (C(5))-methyltransferase [Methanothermococcus okinawensis]|uniref:Cobalt-precorrin-7 (C(5))-methyltransferase n=1 Tax=Methanothermococcus okinawensis TaxID=155863 RepID=A0A833E5N9_9EURY|nr:cobalt-precorrin-7 (C(5))-methyltransferase [Methanothermococcus okinawensis]HIP90685.1 cobalt-precorrin-7 (C(5))-methyltransferase [Methanothermococcus okinawensis]
MKVYLVGVGPGHREYITLKAVDTIKGADIVVGSRRALELFQVEGDRRYTLSKDVVGDLRKVIDYCRREGKSVAILSTGDPCFSGLLKTLLRYNIVGKEEIEVIPGISSIQVAASKLKISWEDYHIVTLHGREENRKLLLDLVKNNKKVIFLPSNLKEDILYLMENGIEGDREIVICENLSYPKERIVRCKLRDVLHLDLSYLVVCVID